MKPKTFYFLMIICAMSLFSAAKQSGSKCDNKKCCKVTEQKAAKSLLPKGTQRAGEEHSPLSLCLFKI